MMLRALPDPAQVVARAEREIARIEHRVASTEAPWDGA
jgi:hypothetical protein